MGKLTPDFRFHRIYEITEKWLAEHQLKALVLDVDNTLTTHNSPVPDGPVVQWLEQMRSSGILGGGRCGMTTILVDPIEPETGRFFRLKRWLEGRILSSEQA